MRLSGHGNMTLKGSPASVSTCQPEGAHLVSRGYGHEVAIGTEGHGGDGTPKVMRPDAVACHHVPQPHLVVQGAAGHQSWDAWMKADLAQQALASTTAFCQPVSIGSVLKWHLKLLLFECKALSMSAEDGRYLVS